MKELLSDDDLRQLDVLDGKPPQWAISATQRNSDQDRFLAGLEIIGWDIEHFIAKLPSPHFQQWLGTKPVDWHQQMYALFHDYYSGLWRNEDRDRLKKLPVVRLSDGSHSTGDKCYFPSAGVDSDPDFPRVDQRVYLSGNNKTQQEKARKLLETIGVRDVGEADQVQSILKWRYNFVTVFPDDKTNLEDLERFMAFVEKEPAQASMFSEYYVFKGTGDIWHWHKPARVFLDSPYSETGLTAYFDALGDALGPGAGKRALSEWYNQNSISSEQLVRFAQAVGVQTKLDVERRSTEKHRCVNTLRADYIKKRVRWTDTAIDDDWMISSLEFLLHNTSEALSRLVWQTLCGPIKKVLRARFRPNQHYTLREQSSSLVLLLQETPWVPQNNGRFVRPLEASRASLPKGFPVR